jgi:hypothetical protein
VADIDRDAAGSWLTLLVAGLIVVVAVIGYLIYSGAASNRSVDVAMNLRPSASAPAAAPTPLPKPAG